MTILWGSPTRCSEIPSCFFIVICEHWVSLARVYCCAETFVTYTCTTYHITTLICEHQVKFSPYDSICRFFSSDIFYFPGTGNGGHLEWTKTSSWSGQTFESNWTIGQNIEETDRNKWHFGVNAKESKWFWIPQIIQSPMEIPLLSPQC